MGETRYSLAPFKYSTQMQSLDICLLSGLTVNAAEVLTAPPPLLIVITSSHLLFPFFILISIEIISSGEISPNEECSSSTGPSFL